MRPLRKCLAGLYLCTVLSSCGGDLERPRPARIEVRVPLTSAPSKLGASPQVETFEASRKVSDYPTSEVGMLTTIRDRRQAEREAVLGALSAAVQYGAAVKEQRLVRVARVAHEASSLSLPPAAAPPSTLGQANCGGDLPPCYVVQRESGGNYNAFNRGGCGGNNCYGAFQFSGAWAGKLGLPLDLATATPEQQDNAARLLWRNGAGCSNWSACG